MGFPKNVRLVLENAGRQASPVVARDEMEKGPAKTRRIATDPVITTNATLLFLSGQAADDFENWFYAKDGANGGAAWFQWVDPRGVMREVRLVSTSMGTYKPLTGGYAVGVQTCALEYVRRTAP